jgi:murein DD-endopeptidase MepM/ murein hydrolase activator NlpD
MKRLIAAIQTGSKFFITEFSLFLDFFFYYTRKKIVALSLSFEGYKNLLVKFFLMKRGRYNRPFLYPVFSAQQQLVLQSQTVQQSIETDQNVFHTEVSDKPRDKVLIYTAEKGDTVSTIAKKFGISSDTVRWANDLQNDNITVGDELKILPVTGMVHKVAAGDTVYSIAKKYQTNPQAIVDFPFNDFANPETFSLITGQMVIVPDGVKPSERPVIRQQVYIAQGPVPVAAGGFTWPLRGEISQFPAWYHMALDIISPVGTPIVAAHSGRVIKASVGTWDGGYGNNVEVDNGSGTVTLYAHMNALNVSGGQDVVGGSTVVGWVGLTGRTTGAHLHFEIRRNGALVNPLPYLQ